MDGVYCVFGDDEPVAQAYADQAYDDLIATTDPSLLYATWTATYRVGVPYVDPLPSPNGVPPTTLSWASPLQRLTDNAWVVAGCPLSDNSGQTLETSDPSWFPPEAE